jgi:hypothetical protein
VYLFLDSEQEDKRAGRRWTDSGRAEEPHPPQQSVCVASLIPSECSLGNYQDKSTCLD